MMMTNEVSERLIECPECCGTQIVISGGCGACGGAGVVPAPPKISTPVDADLDDTQEIDSPMQYRTGGEDDFVECAICAVKPGSPTLCEPCLQNRATIDALQTIVEELKRGRRSAPSEPFDGDQRIPAELDYRSSQRDAIEEIARYVEGSATGYSETFDNMMRSTARSIRRHFVNGLPGLAAPAGLTLEQELWVRGFLAEQRARQYAANPSEAGDALLSDFRKRFPGALP